MIKYGLIPLGFLDLLTFVLTFKIGLITFEYIELFPLSGILKLLLIVSLLLTGILSILKKKIALVIYYFQFPLRPVFLILTFGFLMNLFGSFNIAVIAVALTLELTRLVYTIQIHRRYYCK